MSKNFSIVEKRNEKSVALAEKLRAKLLERNFVENEENPELVFIVGGDGSILYAVQKYLEKLDSIKFIGLHSGNLGFLMDFREDEIDALISALEKDELIEERYPLLETKTDSETYFAINEVRFENLRKTQEVEVFLNDEKLEDFSGTGILVSTQLGSTAYNRSLGGAVIEKGLNLLELTEIAGTSRANLHSIGVPLVLNDETKIAFVAKNFEDSFLGFDSELVPLAGKTKIEVKKSAKSAKILRKTENNFYKSLKKLF